MSKNYDIIICNYRFLDLSKKLFYLSDETLKIKDFIFFYYPKHSYLYSNDQIKKF
jgi:hypothetical protein